MKKYNYTALFEVMDALTLLTRKKSIPSIHKLLNCRGEQQLAPARIAKAFAHAIILRDLEMVKLFVEYDHNLLFKPLYTKYESAMFAIHLAAESGTPEIIRYLVQSGADVNLAMSPSGHTPLHLVFVFNRQELLKVLFDSGANPNPQAQELMPPLHSVCEIDCVPCFDFLRRANVSMHRLYQDMTAYEYCESLGSQDVLTAFNVRGYSRRNSIDFAKVIDMAYASLTNIPLVSLVGFLIILQLMDRAYQRKQEEIKLARQALLQKQAQTLQELNQFIQNFYPNGVWQKTEVEGQFVLSWPNSPINISLFAQREQDKKLPCSLNAVDAQTVILRELSTLNLRFTAPNQVIVNADHVDGLANLILPIKNKLSEACVETESYREALFANTRFELQNEHASLLQAYEQLKVTHQTNVTTSLKNTHELERYLLQYDSVQLATNNRIAQPLEFLRKQLNHPSKQVLTQITTTISQLEEMAAVIQDAKQFAQLDASRIILKKIAEYPELPPPTSYATTIRSAFDALTSAVNTYYREQSTPIKTMTQAEMALGEKQRKREEKKREEELEMLLRQRELEAKKLQQQQKRIEKQKQREQELREQAEKERLNAERIAKTQAASSTATLGRQLIQDKIIYLGDLLQRCETQSLTESEQIRYKYAMLTQALRLFELTAKVESLGTANRIRNALMHHHRYFDLEALVEFVSLIARKPTSQIQTEPKLEDLLKTPMAGNRQRIVDSLNHLTQSDFYIRYVRVDNAEITTRELLEVMHHLFADLSKLKTKEDINLSYFPDISLAIRGILTCIGECEQRLSTRNTRFDNPLFNQFASLRSQSKDFAALLFYAATLRRETGHAMEDPAENHARFTWYLRHADKYANGLRELLSNEPSPIVMRASSSTTSGF